METFKIDYRDFDAQAVIEVDHDNFTPEAAMEHLTFFTWLEEQPDLDEPVLSAIKTHALAAIRVATFNNYNEHGVQSYFQDLEGYFPLDGSAGLKLLSVTPYSFYLSELDVTGSSEFEPA